MASDVDICNLALSHCGDEATIANISPSDGSQQADYCVRFYPIARDQVLSMHAWNCNTKRTTLALLDTDELPTTWAYCYAAPANALNVIAVLLPGTTDTWFVTDPSNPLYGTPTQPGDAKTQPFIQEVLQDGTQVIFTNVEDAECRYTVSISDTTKFSPLMIIAIARLLASYLAGPIVKGEAGMKVAAMHLKSFFNVEFPLAASADHKSQKVNLYDNFIPAGVQARA